MLVGMASKISKNYTQVLIAQDTMESRVPRLNVHTNQILAHTFSHGTLDFVESISTCKASPIKCLASGQVNLENCMRHEDSCHPLACMRIKGYISCLVCLSFVHSFFLSVSLLGGSVRVHSTSTCTRIAFIGH